MMLNRRLLAIFGIILLISLSYPVFAKELNKYNFHFNETSTHFSYKFKDIQGEIPKTIRNGSDSFRFCRRGICVGIKPIGSRISSKDNKFNPPYWYKWSNRNLPVIEKGNSFSIADESNYLNLTYNISGNTIKEKLKITSKNFLFNFLGIAHPEEVNIKFTFNISIPNNTTLIYKDNPITNGTINGTLWVNDFSGRPVMHILQPFVVGGINLSSDIYVTNNTLKYTVLIPLDYLIDLDVSKYPLTIDPTIVFDTNGIDVIASAPLNYSRFVVSYCDDTNSQVVWKVYDTNGTLVSSNSSVDSIGACYDNNLDVTALDSNTFVLGYFDRGTGEVRGKVFNVNGSLVSSFTADNDAMSSTAPDTCSVTTLDSDTFLIAWYDTNDHTYKYSVYYSNGTIKYSETSIYTSSTGSSVTPISVSAFTNNSFGAVFCADKVPYYKTMYSYGTAITDTVQIGDYCEKAVDIKTLSSTVSAIEWYDYTYNEFKMQFKDINGTNHSSVISLASSTSDYINAVSIAKLNSTVAVFTWEDEFTSTQYHYYYGIYNVTGTAIEPSVLVATSNVNVNYPYISVSGYASNNDFGICNQNFVVAYKKDVSEADWTSYSFEGGVWNGTCENLPQSYIFNINDSFSFSSGLLKSSKFHFNLNDSLGLNSLMNYSHLSNYLIFTHNVTPTSPIAYNHSGYNITITWNVTSDNLDSKYINISYANGTFIAQFNTSPVVLYNYSINNYSAVMWANTTLGYEKTDNFTFNVTDQTAPVLNNVTLSSSPYYVNSPLYIYVNGSDYETNISSVTISILDPNGVLYSDLACTYSNGLWVKSYTPNVVGTWNITEVNLTDEWNNSYSTNPNVSFQATTSSTSSGGGGGGGGSVIVTQALPSSSENSTFTITPANLMDVIAYTNKSFDVRVTVTSKNLADLLIKAKIYDPCGFYQNFTTNANLTAGYYYVKPLQSTDFVFHFRVPSNYSKKNCNLEIAFENNNGKSQKLTVRVWLSGAVKFIKRFMEIMYYPIKFQKGGNKIEFLTQKYFAVFPADFDFTIPFFGVFLLIWSFMMFRWLLFKTVIEFRNPKNKRKLFIASSLLTLLLFVLIFSPASLSFLTSTVVYGYVFVLFLIVATVGLFSATFI